MRVSFKRRRQIPRSLAASVTTDEFSIRVTKLLLNEGHKNYFQDWSLVNSHLPF